MFNIALTGGIASGKSLAASLFAQLGIPIIDADILSRELVAPNTAGLKAVIAHFGQAYLDEKGNLARGKLRDHIFEFPQDRLWLEQLLHPQIYALMKERVNLQQAPYNICVIPLLCEAGGKPDFIDRIVVIDIPEAMQLQRLIQRDNMTEIQAQNILKSQCSRTVRLAGADDVLENSGDPAALRTQVAILDKQYRKRYD